MPSGSKKRKAAKKKKEQQAVNNNPHGNDDMKIQDERDSDGTDVGSPASQGDHNHNHQHQHPFNHREEERKTGPSPVESHVTEEKSMEESARDAKGTGKSGLVEHYKRTSTPTGAGAGAGPAPAPAPVNKCLKG